MLGAINRFGKGIMKSGLNETTFGKIMGLKAGTKAALYGMNAAAGAGRRINVARGASGIRQGMKDFYGSGYMGRKAKGFGGRLGNYFAAGDMKGQGWQRGAAIGARGATAAIGGGMAADFFNPWGLGWGD